MEDQPTPSGQRIRDMHDAGRDPTTGVKKVFMGKAPKPRPKELPSMQRSMFGKMADSQKRSGPKVGFGTAKRFPGKGEAMLRQYISKEHMKNAFGMEKTPAPGEYKMPSCFGEQKDSTKRTFGIIHFQRNGRFNQDEREQRKKQQIPAPWSYSATPGYGKQLSSLKPTEPEIKFGTESRDQVASIGKGYEEFLFGKTSQGPIYKMDGANAFGKQAHSGRFKGPAFAFGTEPTHTDPSHKNPNERRAAAVPGPGQYKLPAACADQPNSLHTSAPVYGMGTATRTQAGMASLEPHRAPTMMGGKFSPGVGTYHEKVSSITRGVDSTKRNNPGIVFGTDDKLARNRSTAHLAPGPGTYCV